MQEQIRQFLITTISPQNQESLNQAEASLNQLARARNFHSNLMTILGNMEENLQIRQAAGAYLRSSFQKHWRPMNTSDESIFMINEEEKLIIKQQISQTLLSCMQIPILIKNFEKILLQICKFEFPKKWPQAMLLTHSLLIHENTFIGGLIFLKQLLKQFDMTNEDETDSVQLLVKTLFPFVEKMFENYQTINKLLMNIFYLAIRKKIPEYLQNEVKFNDWMIILKVQLEQGDFKTKKTCGKVLEKLVQTYCHQKDDLRNSVAEYYIQTYSTFFLQSAFSFLSQSLQTQIPNYFLHYCILYINYSLQNIEQNYSIIAPQMLKLGTYFISVFDVLIPHLNFTADNQEQFDTDAEEYIKKQEDKNFYQTCIKNTILNLINTICDFQDQDDQPFIQKIFSQIVFSLQNNLPFEQKDAYYSILIHIRPKFQKNSFSILEKHIFNAFQDIQDPPYIRARIAKLFGEYSDIDIQNQIIINKVVEFLYNCLNDSKLPVRVNAGVSLGNYLYLNEVTNMLRPGLSQILQIYLRLINQIDNDGLINSLQRLIDLFSQEIHPYAMEIFNQLGQAFHKYQHTQLQKNQPQVDYDEDEENQSGKSCLNAMKTLLECPLPTEIYQELLQKFIPILNYILSLDTDEYFETASACFNLFLYHLNDVSFLSQYFPIFCYLVTGHSQDIKIENQQVRKVLEYSRENSQIAYICKELKFRIFFRQPDFFRQKDFFGKTFIELYFHVINQIIESTQENSQDKYQFYATSLYILLFSYIALIESSIGQIDSFIPYILEQCVKCLLQNKNNSYKRLTIQPVYYSIQIFMCMWYNADLSVSYLLQNNHFENLFSLCFGQMDKFKEDYEKIRIFLGLLSILQMSNIPPFITNNISFYMKNLVNMTTELLNLRQQDQQSSIIEDQQTLYENDEDSEDDELECANDMYNSPLEKFDEITQFQKILIQLQSQNNQLYQVLINQLNNQEQTILSENFQKAQLSQNQ